MARAAAMGLPHSLDNLGRALKLNTQKDKEGHSADAAHVQAADPRAADLA
jgi:hypothetical protein